MSPLPTLELADIVRGHGEEFLCQYGASLTQAQRKALRDLAACRTAALGGQWWQCRDCGRRHVVYHSCRNRHCPKCQAQSRADWLDRQMETLLPVEYFHVVFTLPDEIARVALVNPSTVYGLLFQAAQETLVETAADPKHLGALPGILMVLHTWGRTLQHHPHVHCVVTGGGLSCDEDGAVDDRPRWQSCRPGFFLPVRVLSRKFRGKFLTLLREAFVAGRLRWDAWVDGASFASWARPLYEKEWVVYAKEPFGGPEQVLKYLARYTHRTAIGNSRLRGLSEGEVTFAYKDHRHPERTREMTLEATEFLRRWVQHVLPRGFVKVRYYGLLSNRRREERLALCRRLLLGSPALSRPLTCAPAEADRVPEACCPHCGSASLAWLGEWSGEGEGTRVPAVADSS
jgi:putative transposase/transposase-like zinc-binding protein